ncbi:MAG: S24 family peptidase [SAR324 cluster bacterium]|nr:S24 family peptidase [SAR324 cluster bacterium]
MFLTIPNIAQLLNVLERGVQQKAVRQEWPYESRAEGKGYPAHYYPLNQLPDNIQWACVKVGEVNREEAVELLSWPLREKYFQPKPKKYDGYSLGLFPEARKALLERFPDLSDIKPDPTPELPQKMARGGVSKSETNAGTVKETQRQWGRGSQSDEGHVGVTFFEDVNAAAGQGAYNGQEESIRKVMISHSMIDLLIPGVTRKDLSMIRVHGDSMEPKIKEGDLIMVAKQKDVIYDGSIYIIRVGDVVYVKRVQRLPNQINLVSDNKAYSTITITGEELNQIEVIGQVVGKMNVEQF